MAVDATYGPKVYMADGGDRQVLGAGASQDVQSGAEIDVEAGGLFKIVVAQGGNVKTGVVTVIME